MPPADILILANGAGEVSTWVRPVVRELRRQYGEDRRQLRISLVLIPDANASGQEVAVARRFPEIDRIQAARHFWPFLLRGRTAERWDWRSKGVVVFLGGDQLFAVLAAKRLGYRCVLYAEWQARWLRWVDAVGAMNERVGARLAPRWRAKLRVVGDLMTDAAETAGAVETTSDWVGLMPGSKPNKLRMGVPFVLAIADAIARRRAGTNFLIPLAPTLEPADLLRWADPQRNPVAPLMGRTTATLERDAQGQPQLQTSGGVTIPVVTEFPAYDAIRRCRLCLTTIGANTAELGALGMPMIVLLPTQHWESMDAWDGLLGLICRLPGLGRLIRRWVNRWMVKRVGLLAWPNIWAGEAIVPELMGPLSAEAVAERVIDYLDHPAKLEQMRDRLRAARGEPGAAARFARLIGDQLTL